MDSASAAVDGSDGNQQDGVDGEDEVENTVMDGADSAQQNDDEFEETLVVNTQPLPSVVPILPWPMRGSFLYSDPWGDAKFPDMNFWV